jgi:hypothetical protein
LFAGGCKTRPGRQPRGNRKRSDIVI